MWQVDQSLFVLCHPQTISRKCVKDLRFKYAFKKKKNALVFNETSPFQEDVIFIFSRFLKQERLETTVNI